MTNNFNSVIGNRYKVHTGLDTKIDSSKEASGIYKSFIIMDKPNFEGLKLNDEYKWRKLHGLTAHQKREFMANDPNYLHAEETRSYSGPQGIAIAYLNHETGIHQMDIHIQNQVDNEDSMKAVKSMFELELGCPLYPKGTEIEDPVFNFCTKLKSN